MGRSIGRITLAACALAGSTPALAHELECTKGFNEVELDAGGNPVLDQNGFPLTVGHGTVGVLRIDHYPFVLGAWIAVHNVAADASVVTGVDDTMASALAALSPQSFGDAIAAGLALAPDAFARNLKVVRIESFEQCLALAGTPADAPICGGTGENRLTLSHESGSAECRARLVCVAPSQAPDGVLQ